MKKISLRHDIQCSADRFWELFFDEEFNRAMYVDDLGFPEYTQLSFEKTDSLYTRVVRGRPKMNAPKTVQKVLGDSFSYEEHGKFEVASKLWTWHLKPSVMEGKLLTSGSVRVESKGDDACVRIAEITCEAKIFGVGGVLESTMEKEMDKGWAQSAGFTNRWLKDHPA